MTDFDEDAAQAAFDLIERSGASGVEVGYLREGVPSEEADWYAHARYRGARIIAEHRAGPAEALEAVARRLVDGGTCTYCGQPITISGTSRGGVCRWSRVGAQWVRGCVGTHTERVIKTKGPL